MRVTSGDDSVIPDAVVRDTLGQGLLVTFSKRVYFMAFTASFVVRTAFARKP